MNFFPFHPGDYMLRTAHLEPMEDLAYRRLIDLYYVNEEPLTGTPDELSRVVRLRSNSAQVEAVLREFFTETDGAWSHSHCDEVIQQYRAKASQAAENGKRGGRPKKTQSKPNPNPEKTEPVIFDNPGKTGSKANQEPITNNQDKDQKLSSSGKPEDAPGWWETPDELGDDPKQDEVTPPSKRVKAVSVPYQKILEAYQRILPELPQPVILSDSRKAAIASRWKQDERFRDVEFWERYFEQVKKSSFLMGMRGTSIDWLTKPTNFLKVIEGNYDDA